MTKPLPTWIQPVIGPQLDPVTNQHKANADEEGDYRGSRWFWQKAREFAEEQSKKDSQ